MSEESQTGVLRPWEFSLLGWGIGLVSASFAAALMLQYGPSIIVDPYNSMAWFIRYPILGVFVAVSAYLAGIQYPIVYRRVEEVMDND